MSIGRDIRRAIKELERQQGRPVFEWPVGSGTVYACARNVAESSKSLEVGGFLPEADLSLFVRREVLPETLPAEKHKLAFGGKVYRIDRVSKVEDTVVKFMCNDPNRGA